MDFQEFCEDKTKQGEKIVKENNINYEELVKKYSNKSKSEIFSELINLVKKQKENKTFNAQQLTNIYNTLSPMMSEEERNNLKNLIKTLNDV